MANKWQANSYAEFPWDTITATINRVQGISDLIITGSVTVEASNGRNAQYEATGYARFDSSPGEFQKVYTTEEVKDEVAQSTQHRNYTITDEAIAITDIVSTILTVSELNIP